MEDKPFAPSSSSSFKPKLNDQDYMELVCENGQILAKSRSGFFKNQRTQSLLDLYETEYDESFKNNIKNHGDTQIVPVNESQQQQDEEMNNKRVRSSTLIDDSAKNAPPDEQSAAVGRSTELYFASSSMVSRGTSTDLSCRSLKRKYEDIEEGEEEESTYLSNTSDDESEDAKTQVLTRTRKTMTKRISEREKRRDDINTKMRALQDLLPNCYKEDKASLLDEAIKYMRTLQLQVQMMSNGVIRPPTMLPLMSHYSPNMLMNGVAAAAAASSLPQFLPMNVHGAGFQGINNASPSQMLSFFNHSTGLIPNSPIFYPLEHNSQQFVVPSCVPQTQATTSFTQFPKSASTSNLEDSVQVKGSNGKRFVDS